MHLATSGNYRNSVTFNGKDYSHTIDPTTGTPIVGGAPSVTVADDTVARADAWATALTAMHYKSALALAKQQNVAALFVIARNTADSEEWQIVETPAMQLMRANKKPQAM